MAITLALTITATLVLADAAAVGGSPLDADMCLDYPSFPPYHEGIEYHHTKGILVGAVNDASGTISIVGDNGTLRPWTAAAKPPRQLGQLGLHVDRRGAWEEPDRLLTANLNAAPLASNAGVQAFDIATGGEIFYWNGTAAVVGNFTPNDLTACGPRRAKVYVTDHVNGYICEVENETSFRVLAQVRENRFTATLETNGFIVNGIECMSDDVLLVAFMTPPGQKGKILRVDMDTGAYTEVPLPDVHGVGTYSRFDGFFKEDATTLWITTNTGNRRVLKIVATDPSWTEVRAVFAGKPTTCDQGANGPTTGVLVGEAFLTSGDKVASIRKWSLDLVYPSSNPSPGGTGGSSDYPSGLVTTLAVFCAILGASVLVGGVLAYRRFLSLSSAKVERL